MYQRPQFYENQVVEAHDIDINDLWQPFLLYNYLDFKEGQRPRRIDQALNKFFFS